MKGREKTEEVVKRKGEVFFSWRRNSIQQSAPSLLYCSMTAYQEPVQGVRSEERTDPDGRGRTEREHVLAGCSALRSRHRLAVSPQKVGCF